MKKFYVLFLLFVSCKQIPQQPIVSIQDTPTISLTISNAHQEIFNIKNFSYSEQNSKQIFNQIEQQTDIACARKDKIKGYNWVMSDLINGCLNFYLLNDHDVYKAFSMVKEMSKNKKDCYTVGFAQLYLINEFVECENLTSIDVDWRIIYAHYQMIENIKKQKNMYDIKLFNKEKNNGLKTFCADEDFIECKFAFDAFQHDYRKINSINYSLSHLHDANIKKTDNDIVIFVSNAIDPEYTTQEQYEQFVNNIYKALKRNTQHAYVVYHTGGHNTFAIYRLFKIENTRFKSAVYRDDLVWAKSYGGLAGKRYKTYFDD